MEVYILRHAIAVSHGAIRYANDDRPLTEEGIALMKEAARGIAELMDPPDLILTSPMKRAEHTARIAAKALGVEERIEITRKLLPGAKPEDILAEIARSRNKERVMIVGHEPDLGLFVSSLLGSPGPAIEFKKGALCKVDLGSSAAGGARGMLIWHLAPSQLRAIGRKKDRKKQ